MAVVERGAVVVGTACDHANPAGNAALNKPVISEEVLGEPVLVDDVAPSAVTKAVAAGPAYVVLIGISFSHFLNDTMQSLIASVYPILKHAYALNFAQIGMITLAFQFTASLLQPVVGHMTDKKPQPFSLSVGMGSTFVGLLLLSVAGAYPTILIAAALVGLGSAVFHPESARIARLASADAMASRNRCFSSAAAPAPRWARCSRR
jgi:FSR family fosmidomycin resistance protein-like MFS transporter